MLLLHENKRLNIHFSSTINFAKSISQFRNTYFSYYLKSLEIKELIYFNRKTLQLYYGINFSLTELIKMDPDVKNVKFKKKKKRIRIEVHLDL